MPLDAKGFEYAVSVLFQAGSSPRLRAALHEVVAEIDGVERIGEARDPLGRVGTALALDTEYGGRPERYELFFDAETSQPLAFTEKLLEPQEWQEGLLLEHKVLVESGHVRSTDSRPSKSAEAERRLSAHLIEALSRGEDRGSGPWLALLGVGARIAVVVALLGMRSRRNRKQADSSGHPSAGGEPPTSTS